MCAGIWCVLPYLTNWIDDRSAGLVAGFIFFVHRPAKLATNGQVVWQQPGLAAKCCVS